MPGATCPTCGLRLSSAGPCTVCIASTAIARGAGGSPAHCPAEPLEPNAADPLEPMPSIVREYNYSFLRIFGYYMLLAAFTVVAIALGWWLFGW